MRKISIAVLLFLSLALSAGAADLALSLSMNLAGGGPDKFTTTKLVGRLFGRQSAAELATLRKRFGSSNVSSFFVVSDFAVPDAMDIIQQKNTTMPDNPSPAPENAKALGAALYRASLGPGGKVQAETLLDNLLSRPVRDQLVADIDKKFDAKQRRNYFSVLTQLASDLHPATGGAKGVPHP